MKIHHLNCGCMCPIGGRLFDGYSKSILKAHLCCHCLLLETNGELILVDTGFGSKDVERPYSTLSPFFINLNRIRFLEEHTAIWQIRKLGFDPNDVRHIVLTHLDFDHAGGLEDFPNAKVHVMQQEYQAATHKRGFISKNRYSENQWAKITKWQFYKAEGTSWFGFDSVHELMGLPPEIIMVPLIGHTLGHAGIAIKTSDKWLLHAGDAYFFHDEIYKDVRKCPLGFRLYQWLMEADRSKRLQNQDRLRNLVGGYSKDIDIFCSHDIKEFSKFSQACTNN